RRARADRAVHEDRGVDALLFRRGAQLLGEQRLEVDLVEAVVAAARRMSRQRMPLDRASVLPDEARAAPRAGAASLEAVELARRRERFERALRSTGAIERAEDLPRAPLEPRLRRAALEYGERLGARREFLVALAGDHERGLRGWLRGLLRECDRNRCKHRKQ